MNIKPPAENVVLPGMRHKRPGNVQELHEQRRLGFIGWMPKTVRAHVVAWLGEFVGTFLFLFFAFGATKVANQTTQRETGGATAAQAPNTSNLLYISLAFGFSLAVNAWVFFRITGGLFNPAVTVGMMLIGAVSWVRGAIVISAQLVGSIASSAVVLVLFPGGLAVQTTLSPGTSIVRGLFIEMFLTAELVFTIFMLAAEKHKATFIAPIGIGLSLFIAELPGVYFTGGSLNPARSFGPAVAIHSFPGYHWIYWLGPFLGTLVAVAFYKLVKGLEYETVNPGADDAKKQEEGFENDEDRDGNIAMVSRNGAPMNGAGYMADHGPGAPLPHSHPVAPTSNPMETVQNNREYRARQGNMV